MQQMYRAQPTRCETYDVDMYRQQSDEMLARTAGHACDAELMLHIARCVYIHA